MRDCTDRTRQACPTPWRSYCSHPAALARSTAIGHADRVTFLFALRQCTGGCTAVHVIRSWLTIYRVSNLKTNYCLELLIVNSMNYSFFWRCIVDSWMCRTGAGVLAGIQLVSAGKFLPVSINTRGSFSAVCNSEAGKPVCTELPCRLYRLGIYLPRKM